MTVQPPLAPTEPPSRLLTFLASLVKQALTGLGAVLVAGGYLTSGQATSLTMAISGVIIILVSAVWSYAGHNAKINQIEELIAQVFALQIRAAFVAENAQKMPTPISKPTGPKP